MSEGFGRKKRKGKEGIKNRRKGKEGRREKKKKERKRKKKEKENEKKKKRKRKKIKLSVGNRLQKEKKREGISFFEIMKWNVSKSHFEKKTCSTGQQSVS